MINERNEKRFLIALLLAILIHCLLALFLFIHKKITTIEEQLSRHEALNKEQRKAPVVFQHDEEPQKTIDPSFFQELSTPAALIPGASSEKTITDAENIPAPNALQQAEAEEQAEPIVEEDSETNMQEHENALPENVAEPLPETPSQAGVATQQRAPRKKRSRRSRQPHILKRTYADAPKLKNVIEGFSKFMHEEGNNAHLERAGSRNGFFDPEEAKLIAYYNKVIEFFKHADTTYPDYVSRAISYFIEKHPHLLQFGATCKLVIARNGTLEEIKLLESSGIREYDELIMTRFKQAAPYPPIPQHLKREKIIFPIYIYSPVTSSSGAFISFKG